MKIIQFINDPYAPYWHGYAYAGAMFIVQFLGLILIHQYFHIVITQGMRVRVGLRTAVYKKTLRLSQKALTEMSTGDIINLMSIDTQKLGDMLTYLHMIWSAVLQVL